jgi:hypothetical protein
LPLPQHPYARLAARYANAAAGSVSTMPSCINYLQHSEIDTQVAQVLQPGLLVMVRDSS